MILGITPARGGSKRVPRKNVRTICGKPLIAWTIGAAQKSKRIDKYIVSTDDSEIALFAVVQSAGFSKGIAPIFNSLSTPDALRV